MSDQTTEAHAAAEKLSTNALSSFSELFDKSLARTKDAHEKAIAIMRHTTDAFGEAVSCANKGATEYRMTLLKIAREHADAAFDVATQAMSVKSPAELVELSSTHARKQFELASAQMKDLAALAQRVVSETTEPMRTSMTEPFRLAS